MAQQDNRKALSVSNEQASQQIARSGGTLTTTALKAQLQTGASALDLTGSAITRQDEQYVIGKLSLHFGKNWAAKDPETGRTLPSKASEVVDGAKRKGWSRERLLATLEAFLDKPQYPTWTPGEFLSIVVVPLRDRVWKDALLHDRYTQGIAPEKIMADIEGFMVDGEQVWRIADPAHPLPFERIWPIEIEPIRALPVTSPANPETVAEIISDVKAALIPKETEGEGR